MSKPVISFERVSKSYYYWHNRPYSIKKMLIQLVNGKLDMGNQIKLDVLDDVSLKIFPGEFVGIMGRNGAGKSSLLKLIAGIYMPNSGTIKIEGKVAPLLELGAGFADELSGYENIFLNAAILGFGKHRTMEYLDSIIEFAELGDKIHMPVRNYSSGMMMRLGFSIASHLDAPILLFDEILAVGDVGFQKKCIDKIQELYKSGRSIILVTHSPYQVEQFCSRCILIDDKKVIFDGDAKSGAKKYLEVFS